MSTTREQILARFTQWWDESDDISNDGPWEPDSMIQFAWAGYNAAIQQYKDSLLKMGKIIEKRTIERCAIPDNALQAIKDACSEAMHYTLAARIPECGNFGEIAQNLSFALQEIAAIRKLGE